MKMKNIRISAALFLTIILFAGMTGRYVFENIKAQKVTGNTSNQPLYLLHDGDLDDLEIDFLAYVKTKGQKIAGESFIPVHKTRTFLSYQPKGELKIVGAASMAPMMEKMAEEYMRLNPNAKISVKVSNTTQGFMKTFKKECNFGMASRELKDYEKTLLECEMTAKTK